MKTLGSTRLKRGGVSSVKTVGSAQVKSATPQSLIELTHGFADFLSPAYRRIKKGVLFSRVLNADETPHKMLDGSDKKSWYL